MSSICKECGHLTEWAQDIGSAVCTQCGTLADSSQQSALTSPLDFINSHDVHTSTYAPSTTLKSIRRNAAWDLPGQGANSRNERNKSSTHDLIRTLSDRLGHRGAAIRAQAIFDSTMQRTSTRWGKAAKRAAGAAVVFAMREQGRGDRTHHVAYLLSEPVVALKRAQLHLLPHLDLTLPRTQPHAHLPALASHLSVLASASPTSLPKDTLAFLRPLVLSPAVLHDVLRTARALHDLPALEGCISDGTSSSAFACALLLLALEARARPPRSAPHVLVLAAQLGAAYGTRGAAVMSRYRSLVDIVEADAARIPWLADASATGGKRVSRRSTVAKAALDVLQFRDELERAEIAERGGPISVNIEEEDEGGVERSDHEDEAALDDLIAKVELDNDNTGAVSRAPKGVHATTGTTVGPLRRYKRPRTTTSQAALFLLDPLAHYAPAQTALAHTSYLLSSDAATESVMLPTRLQLLAVERGNAEAISDDELFSDGELEGIVIDADEAGEELGRRAQTLQMMWGEEDGEATRADPADISEVAGGNGGKKRGKDRVDMDKLTALLDSDDPFAALGPSEGEEDAGDGGTELIVDETCEVVSEWRPYEEEAEPITRTP